ncbi:hypothetical protein D9613_003955 [Agrocybe pediades]|uniref:Peptidase M20 domain-containing protein 2 n=1 Tax=Agrocybe pediades TaxID=84607 RepID=A0A8H4QKA2_9AGAR|nr:hypothetical protein D9613_003955 [Agrocybe pediades]
MVSTTGPVWRPDDGTNPAPAQPIPSDSADIYRPDVLETIASAVKELDAELKELSLDIHAHPELGYEEYHAHDAYTAFLEKHNFEVTRKYHLETAWKATFTNGQPGEGRVIGINSEMDALKGIGHACGHNLIGIAGVAVAHALRSAMQKHDIKGKIVLLGTPAEEGGAGKVKLLDKGAYEEMDVCLMCHPAPGPVGSVSLTGCLAVGQITAEYTGHTAHAALSPWEGKNALDAAVLAYNNISALRQQLKPTVRVHGIFEGKDWAVNIIPDYAKYNCLVRAPTSSEMHAVIKRVIPCFEAAALATGTQVTIKTPVALTEIRQNKALGQEVERITKGRYGGKREVNWEEWGIKDASTDFGNVTHALPSLHPGFAIPTVVDGGNHTRAFAASAATPEAHQVCLDISIALAGAGVRVLLDDKFWMEVKTSFEEDKERIKQGF